MQHTAGELAFPQDALRLFFPFLSPACLEQAISLAPVLWYFFVTFHCESTSIQTLVSVRPSIYVLKSTNHTKSKALFILAFQPERKTLDKMLLAHLVVWQVAYNLLCTWNLLTIMKYSTQSEEFCQRRKEMLCPRWGFDLVCRIWDLILDFDHTHWKRFVATWWPETIDSERYFVK